MNTKLINAVGAVKSFSEQSLTAAMTVFMLNTGGLRCGCLMWSPSALCESEDIYEVEEEEEE